MPIEGTTPVSVKPFVGGFIDSLPRNDLPATHSPFLRNNRIFGTECGPRPGFKSVGDAGTGGTFIRGVHYYKRNLSTNDKWLRVHTDKLWTYNTTTEVWDEITSAATLITADAKTFFTGFQDVVFIMNGVDEFAQLDNVTYTEPANVPVGFAPSFSIIFKDIHWASGWDDNANIVYFSVPAGVTLDATNVADFTSAGSGSRAFASRVTGFAATIQFLYVFMLDRIDIRVGEIDVGGTLVDQWSTFTQLTGAVNQESIVTAGNSIFFLSPDNKLQAVNYIPNIATQQVTELSHRPNRGIPNFMGDLDLDQSEAFGLYNKKKQLIEWHVKSEGADFNDLVVLYDITYDEFLIDDGRFFSCGALDRNGVIYKGSHLNNTVFQDDVDNDDDDDPIPFIRETKNFDLQNPTVRKQFRQVKLFGEMTETTELTLKAFVDGEQVVDDIIIDGNDIDSPTGGLGNPIIGDEAVGDDEVTVGREFFTKEISKGQLRDKGKRFALRIESSGVAQDFRLNYVDFTLRPLDPLTNELSEKN